MVQPENRTGAGSNLMSIADALGGFSNAIGSYNRADYARSQNAERGAAKKQKEVDDAEEGMANNIRHMTPDQLSKHFEKNPALLDMEKVQLMYAGKLAEQFGSGLAQDKLDNWDGSVPLDQWAAQRQVEFAQKHFGKNPMVLGYFNKSAEAWVTNILRSEAERGANEAAQGNVDLITSHLNNLREKGVADKVAPGITAQQMFRDIQELPAWKQLNGPTRNRVIIDYAKSLSQTPKSQEDLELINRLLESDRPGGVPSVSKSLEFKEQSALIKEQSITNYRQNNTDAQMPIELDVSQAIIGGKGVAELDRLRQGSGNLLPETWWKQKRLDMVESEQKILAHRQALNAHDGVKLEALKGNREKFARGTAWDPAQIVDTKLPSPEKLGDTIPYTRKDQITDAKNAIIADVRKQTTDKGMDPSVEWGVLASTFSNSNDTVDTWQSALRATPTSLIPAAGAQGITEQQLSNAKLWEYLNGTGFGVYADAHLDETSRMYWNMYDAFRSIGQGQKEAMFAASTAMADRDALGSVRQDVNFAEQSYLRENSDTVVNKELNGDPLARKEVIDMATGLAFATRNSSDALSKAVEIFKKRNEFTKHGWIPKAMKGLPPNLKDNLEAYVDDWVKINGAKSTIPIESSDDIMVVPDNSGRQFYVFQKSTGLPVTGTGARGKIKGYGPLTITLDTLAGFDKLRNDRVSMQDDGARADLTKVLEKPRKGRFGGRGGSYERDLTPEEQVASDRANLARQRGADIKKVDETNKGADRTQYYQPAAKQDLSKVDDARLNQLYNAIISDRANKVSKLPKGFADKSAVINEYNKRRTKREKGK